MSHMVLKQENNKYVSLSILSSEDSPAPFDWWKTSRNSFMNLKKIALKFLSAPPSSVES